MHGLERKAHVFFERYCSHTADMDGCKLGRRTCPSVQWASTCVELFRSNGGLLLQNALIMYRGRRKKKSPQPANKTKNTNRMKAAEI